MIAKYIGYIIIFTLSFTAPGQQLNYKLYEGRFDYALIEDSKIYSVNRANDWNSADYIWTKSLQKPSPVFINYSTAFLKPNYPSAWIKTRNTLFYIIFFSSNTGLANTYIHYREPEKKDSLEMTKSINIKEIPEVRLWITPLSDYYDSFFRLKRIPNRTQTEAMYNTLDFDIHAPSPNLVRFYLRDTTALYVWECQLPAASNPDWKEVKVYTSPKTNFEYPPLKHSKSYSGTKTVRNAIADSLFFDGHFKVIEQGTNKFIINREHAIIYYISDTAIVRVGSVAVPDNYPTIRGKKLFIEDRDNGQLIFFAPVSWENNSYPKPKVKVLNEKEMKEKFKYVLR